MPMNKLVVVSIACCFLGGCATVNEMAMEKGDRAIDTTKKSILLMTVDVSRSDGSYYVPSPFVAKIEEPNTQNTEDRQNFELDKDADTVKDGGRTIYLARTALEPGKYKLGDVTSNANAFPVNSLFVVPLIDQPVTGMSTGTWDVTVDEMSPKDTALFRATYSALAAHIESTPLRPFDRLAVRRWLDGQRVDEQKTLTVPPSPPTGSR